MTEKHQPEICVRGYRGGLILVVALSGGYVRMEDTLTVWKRMCAKPRTAVEVGHHGQKGPTLHENCAQCM